MQPFGLFSLLQSLLDKPQTDTPPPPAEEPLPAPTEPEPIPEDNNRQAILQFLSAHETRAQKNKRR